MRLVVLADIHGNLPALEAVLADVQQQQLDGVIVAGDFAAGPKDPEVVHLLRSIGGWMIRGNREDRFVAYHTGQGPDTWRQSEQWAYFRWMYHRLDQEMLDLMASLPEQRGISVGGTDPIRIVHGAPQGVSDLLLPVGDAATMELYQQAGLLDIYAVQVPLSEAWQQFDESVLVCAHSHIPWVWEQNGRIAINPGSVGEPINGDPRAHYALLTWQGERWQGELRAIPYDLDRVRAAYRESGALEAGGWMARASLRCVETGLNVAGQFVLHAQRSAVEAGYASAGEAPDSIWRDAEATFDWEVGSRAGGGSG